MMTIVSQFRTRASLSRSAALLVALFLCLGAAFLAGTPFALLDWRGFLTEFTIQSRTAFGTHHGSILDAEAVSLMLDLAEVFLQRHDGEDCDRRDRS